MNANHLLYADVTQKIIGSALRVHRFFGIGFPEIIYHRALVIELRKEGLECASEVSKCIYYNGFLIGRRRLDVIVAQKVLIELKSVNGMMPSDFQQVINYLKIFGLKVGLLLNFGSEKLQFKRFICT